MVNTPVRAGGPRARLQSNLDDPEEWELPCCDGESVCWDEQSSSVERQAVPGLVRYLWWDMGIQLEEANYVRDLWEDQLGFSERFAS